MEQLGISYIIPPGSRGDWPNGETLHRQLVAGNVQQVVIDSLVHLYAGSKERAICSSENFTKLGLTEWKVIRNSCELQNIGSEIVVFVRDVAEYYFSLHRQLVKGGEDKCTFTQFCEIDRYSSVRRSLEALLGTFGGERIHVARYDHSGNIGETFMSFLGLKPQAIDFSILQERFNRSLTCYELDLVSKINNAVGKHYSVELCEVLENKFPNLKRHMMIHPEIVDKLADRHQHDIDWINATFFDGADEIKIIQNNSSHSERHQEMSTDDRQSIDSEVITWLANKLGENQKRSMMRLAELCQNIDFSKKVDDNIPEDFDPVAYVINNQDIFLSGVCPFDHFRLHGRHEPGRKWSWHVPK